jgi:hypothetical protein
MAAKQTFTADEVRLIAATLGIRWEEVGLTRSSSAWASRSNSNMAAVTRRPTSRTTTPS